MTTSVKELEVFRIAIPLRAAFRHAAAARTISHNLVVRAVLDDGTSGYGESLPRSYVTGESLNDAVSAVREVLWPKLAGLRAGSFAELLNELQELPFEDDAGRCIHAARCAVELALLDAYSKHFSMPLSEIAGWLGNPAFGRRHTLEKMRVSGVISAETPRNALRKLRMMRLYGLRDFKLKLGTDEEPALLEAVGGHLASAIASGRCSLRVDVNGGWRLETAADRLERLRRFGVCYLEQPLPRGAEAEMVLLRAATELPLMADESVLNLADAQRLIDSQAVDGFNLRISKQGGFIPTLRLAELAYRYELDIQLGCMVGESSILSAAERWLASMLPEVLFAETNYGRFFIRDDVVARPLRFGYGGRLRPLTVTGLGININDSRIRRLASDQPLRLAG